jgi:hypothetical protein
LCGDIWKPLQSVLERDCGTELNSLQVK